MTQVEEIWSEISLNSAIGGVFRRIDEEHPLDIYAGVDAVGKKLLMLVTRTPPPLIPPIGVLELVCNPRADGEWVVLLQLARTGLEEVFGRLCQDLVEHCRAVAPEEGSKELLKRLERWRRLLELDRGNLLSESELRGLIGELWYLLERLSPRVGIDSAVHAWQGPMGSPHDFVFSDCLTEVKTCVPGRSLISISSSDQLESAEATLNLCVIGLATAPPHSVNAFTITSLVDRVRDTLAPGTHTRSEFEFRLAEVSYTENNAYDALWFEVTSVRFFHITDGFPRILASSVPDGVSDLRYVVDLRKCVEHEFYCD
jgi:hypothetical protein